MADETPSPQLILASSSPHRRLLLERLGIPFKSVSPELDETPHPGEAPHELALRLAIEKARTIAHNHPGCAVLGSDQVAVHAEQIVGKPGDASRAKRFLTAFSGESVQFLTAVALVLAPDTTLGQAVVETRVAFRELGEEEIERYVEHDQPLDCAGSFRAESLGPALFESAFSQDPTAIIGLPLIETARLLRMAGFQVP